MKRLAMLFLLAITLSLCSPMAAQGVTPMTLTILAPNDSGRGDSVRWEPRLRRDGVDSLKRFKTLRVYRFIAPMLWLRDSVDAFFRDGGFLDRDRAGFVPVPVRDTTGSLLSASSAWLLAIKADSAALPPPRGYGLAAQDVKAGTIDAGSGPHPDLNIVSGRNYADADSMAWQDNGLCGGHGTHVMGTIGAKLTDAQTMGVGVAPFARLYALRISPNFGGCILYSGALYESLQFAIDSGLNVVNCSCSFGEGHGFDVVVQRATAAGVNTVFAAGNDGGIVNAPADSPGAFAVASWSGSGLSGFSAHDSTLCCSAPGENVTSTMPGGGYGTMSGTSMAGPHVAGIIADMCTVRIACAPAWVHQHICIGAIPVTNGGCGVPQLPAIFRAIIAEGAPTTPALTPAYHHAGQTATGCFAVSGTQRYDVKAFIDSLPVPWITFTYSGRTACWTATPPLGVAATPLFILRSLEDVAPPPIVSTLQPGMNLRTMQVFNPQVGANVTYTYAVYRGSAVSDAVPAPLAVWGHGSGEDGTNINSPLGTSLPADITANPASWAQWIVVIPQWPTLPLGESVPDKNSINRFRTAIGYTPLAATLADCNCDPNRILGLGFSSGSNHTWQLAMAHPTLFAGLAETEGSFEGRQVFSDSTITNGQGDSLTVARTPNLNVWIDHNANDGTQPAAGISRPLSAAWGASFVAPFTTAPTYTNGIYHFAVRGFNYYERTNGGYLNPSLTGGSGGHEGNGLWVNAAWLAWRDAVRRSPIP